MWINLAIYPWQNFITKSDVSLCLSVCLSLVCLSHAWRSLICLSVCLSPIGMSYVCLFVCCLSVCRLSISHLSVCSLSVCRLSISHLSFCLYFICLSISRLSVSITSVYLYLSVCPSLSLSWSKIKIREIISIFKRKKFLSRKSLKKCFYRHNIVSLKN